jgi:hypothetical protein
MNPENMRSAARYPHGNEFENGIQLPLFAQGQAPLACVVPRDAQTA